MVNKNALIWLDMEMTGLCPESDRILEVALVITDSALNIVATSPSWVIHQKNNVLQKMDEWNQTTHKGTGLIEKVKASALTERAAQKAILAFIKTYVNPQLSPLCGNTVHQDRRFLAKWMPKVEAYFHYRNIDVSTLKELAKRWNPAVVKGFIKKSQHEAQADIIESIEEMKYYRKHFIQIPSS